MDVAAGECKNGSGSQQTRGEDQVVAHAECPKDPPLWGTWATSISPRNSTLSSAVCRDLMTSKGKTSHLSIDDPFLGRLQELEGRPVIYLDTTHTVKIRGINGNEMELSIYFPGRRRSSHETGDEPHPRRRQPLVPVDKLGDGEVGRLDRVSDSMKARPLHSAAEARSRPVVHVLAVEERVQGEVTGPLHPPLRLDPVSQIRLHYDGPRILLPRPSQISNRQFRRRRRVCTAPVDRDIAPVDGEARVLIFVLAALRRDGVFLLGQRAAGDDGAALEDGGGVAENEVDGAGNAALPVELPEGVSIERVLVP